MIVLKLIKQIRNYLNNLENIKIWCAASTHNTEGIIVEKTHILLKKKYKNIITIIIPRHINRVNEIKSELDEIKFKSSFHEPIKKINKDIDIYLVNTYGQTKKFFKFVKIFFWVDL